MKYTFEQIPSILKRIENRLDKVEQMLSVRIQKEFPEEDFIGAKEACRILKLSLPTLYSKVCQREVPFYKKGNRLHFSKAELLNWIQEGKKKSLDQINQEANDLMNKNNRKRW
ncbi:helix-turn-helix domain-containing protein [Chryseobacterium sp. 2987]|uniref:helix-turn-helix domain-containing protein n=1 Tax=Chryseobacterium sp. 2987 TaxID=2817767 RepID=UPI0028618001|nr:helix-turn-helix domain-containing protein [Chryseobacterium sp. 2987]MDR6919481.1 excisionase family DNA binding protein [Chryseobacterium sp. 2987]